MLSLFSFLQWMAMEVLVQHRKVQVLIHHPSIVELLEHHSPEAAEAHLKMTTVAAVAGRRTDIQHMAPQIVRAFVILRSTVLLHFPIFLWEDQFHQIL